MHLPPIPRFLARWTIRTVLFIVFICLPAAIIYLREVGIGYELKERVAGALGGNGFRTEIGKLSVDPFKGLVAKNVEVWETTGDARNLARIERLVVSVNFTDLLAGRVTIDHVQLDETDVSIPIGPEPDSPRLDLDGVSAELFILADQMRISSFEGRVQGVKVVLSGSLQNPRAFHLQHPATQQHSQARQELLSKVIETLSTLKFPGAPPELRLKIYGDLADLSTLRISPISLRSGPILTPNWRVDGLEAEADYEKQVVSIKRLKVRAAGGALNLSAHWKDSVLDFELSSTLMPEPFYRMLPEDSALKDLKFAAAPQLEASGRLIHSTSPVQYDVTGAMQVGKFSFRGMDFDSFSTDFASRNGKTFLRDARLLAAGGQINANLLLSPEDFRVHLSNTIAPTAFAPLLGKNEREALRLMDFRDAPYLQLDLRGPKPTFAAVSGTGFLRLGRTSMRGSSLDWGQSKIEVAESAITYRDFSLGRGKAVGKGTFVYDFGGQQILLDNVESTMPPVDVMMWIDPKIAEVIKPYRFRQPPKVRADGMIHMKDLRKNDLHLAIQSDIGLDYDLLNRTLKFGRTLANVDITGTKVIANIKSAELMEGDVGVNATVSIDPADPTFGADIDIRRVNFAQLTKLYFDYEDSQGIGSGNFKFTARMGQEQQMRGDGSLRVEDGHVFAIPILGPLSEIINKMIPGAGFQTARLATADFSVGDEKINTKNLKVEGAGFSLYGYGDIFFVRDKMDMSVRINARGIPGLVLFPVSKLFEYVSTGSVSKPVWRPKIIPRFGSAD
jgi:AsmA-like C-terminal region